MSLTATGDLYVGGQDPHQELLCPFPPILLQVGTNELLLGANSPRRSNPVVVCATEPISLARSSPRLD